MHISVYDEAVLCINVRVLYSQRKTLINNSTGDVQMCQINESDTQRTEVWERIKQNLHFKRHSTKGFSEVRCHW